MYDAAPVNEAGGPLHPGDEDQTIHPVVTLVQMTPYPLRTMAAAAELYRGEVVRNPADVSKERALSWWQDMTRTRLQAPLEFIDLHFLIENVTRAFTHQLVRQRTAVYVQESQRFAVKRNASWEVAMPPGIAELSPEDPIRETWHQHMYEAGVTYNWLIDQGIPAEDARGMLPTNILTKVHYKTNLRNLAEHAGNRLCTQAQFEWRLVWTAMVNAIRDYRGATNWEFDAIADMFRPICYLTGKCEFMAATDRFCQIRERVQNFAKSGVPSSEWSSEKWGHQFRIQPVEWLAMPGSARTTDPEWRGKSSLQ
jgi:flavin-dependent thymidylate synthase